VERAQGALSRLANRTPSASFGSTFRSYVRARGGAGTAARSASSGRASTARLGAFLAGVAQRGVVETARAVGLGDLVGRDAGFVLAESIDLLAPPGALLEDAIARKAMIETMTELFERYEVFEGGIEALDSLDALGMADLIGLSVTNYINERFQQELVNCVERGSVSEREANDLLREAKDFIAGMVRIEFEGVDLLAIEWDGTEGKGHIERVFRDAYSLLGNPS
jgi:hypothetical protein